MSKAQVSQLDIEYQPQQIQVYFQRWLVLLAFGILQFGNVMQLVSYSPIWNQAAEYYSIAPEDLQWFGNMYYITFFTLAPFCVTPLEWRFDYSIQICALISAIGTWTVWVGEQSFFIAMVGFLLIGISDAMILIIPVFLSDKWFSVYERTLSTSIGSFIQFIGMAFAYGFASFYFNEIIETQEFNRRVGMMNLMIAIINSIGVVACLLLIRNRPQTPASNSDNLAKESGWKSIQLMFTNEEALLDLISLGIFIGVGWVYATIISLQLYPYGYLQTDVAINGTVYQLSGILVGSWAALKLDKQVKQGIQPDYDSYIKGFTTLGIIGLILEAFVIEFLVLWQLLILNFFIGVGLNAFYPLAIQAYVEKLYPANQLMLVTGLLSFANAVGFVLNYLLVLPQFLDYGLWIGCLVITPAYLHIFLNFKTKYKRFEMEM